MKITEIKINQFGKLHQKEFVLGEGLNVIYGPNESGKTTLHTFIKSMLFGIQRLRGRAARTDTYSRYEPWENAYDYGGRLRFTCGDRRFRLERTFRKEQPRAVLVCENDGELLSVEDGDLKVLLGEISESIFENTVFIPQLGAPTGTELAMELKNYMANYQDSGDRELDVEQTLLTLKKQKKELQEQLLTRKKERELQGQKLQEQLLYQEEETRALRQKLQKQEMDIQEANMPEANLPKAEKLQNGSYPKKEAAPRNMSGIWMMGMLFLALGAVVGVVALDGWLRFLPLAVGIFGEAILFYWRRCQQKALLQGRRKEQQKREQRQIELEKRLFLKEHLEQELAERETMLENLRSEYEEFAETIPTYDDLPRKLEALDLAAATIHQISSDLQGRIGYRLRRRTSQLFQELTQGRYQQVSLDEALKLSVDTGERHLPAEQLSRGTLEQLYFALRISAAEILCEEEPLPLILDDVFAMYDNQRLTETLSWLSKSGRQVLLLTCHTRELDILKAQRIPHTLICL